MDEEYLKRGRNLGPELVSLTSALKPDPNQYLLECFVDQTQD
jgi:hypothetical protein